ncbi:MAG: hypothetical protein IJ574_05535 [Bacilli bacterium]|nr:hypothetical protein [Bacilli bacterium]
MKKTKNLKDNYYNKIKEKLIEDIAYSAIKDMSKERHTVQTNYEVGKILAEAGKNYGENIIGKYAEKLVAEVHKKYHERTLRRYRQFYLTFENQKWSQAATILNWSHYVELLPLKNSNAILYYIEQCKQLHLTRNKLRNKIKSKEYERLDDETKLKLINKEEITLNDLIPNPIIIKASSIEDKEHIKEYMLKKIIILRN